MKTVYMVKRVNLSKVKDVDEYWDKVKKADVHYCNGLNELWDYCGGKLHRHRAGYSGIINNIEYVAFKVK